MLTAQLNFWQVNLPLTRQDSVDFGITCDGYCCGHSGVVIEFEPDDWCRKQASYHANIARCVVWYSWFYLKYRRKNIVDLNYNF